MAAGEGASAGGPCESRCATGGRRDSFGTGEVKGLTKPWADPGPSISRSSETIFKTHSPCHIKQMEIYSLNVIRHIRFEGFEKLDLFIYVFTRKRSHFYQCSPTRHSFRFDKPTETNDSLRYFRGSVQ